MDATNQIRHVLYCPHCGNTTVQTRLLSQPFMEKYYGVADGNVSLYGDATYNVAKCETCSEVLVYSYTNARARRNPGHTLWLSCTRDVLESERVPDTVRQIYEEAVRVQNISPIAFRSSCAPTLEEICLDKNAQKET